MHARRILRLQSVARIKSNAEYDPHYNLIVLVCMCVPLGDLIKSKRSIESITWFSTCVAFRGNMCMRYWKMIDTPADTITKANLIKTWQDTPTDPTTKANLRRGTLHCPSKSCHTRFQKIQDAVQVTVTPRIKSWHWHLVNRLRVKNKGLWRVRRHAVGNGLAKETCVGLRAF